MLADLEAVEGEFGGLYWVSLVAIFRRVWWFISLRFCGGTLDDFEAGLGVVFGRSGAVFCGVLWAGFGWF